MTTSLWCRSLANLMQAGSWAGRSVAVGRGLLALLLAIRGVLAWTSVDTAGRFRLRRSDFGLVLGRLTRERSQVQVLYGPHSEVQVTAVRLSEPEPRERR